MTDYSEADIDARFGAARARWGARSKDSLKEFGAYYLALKKEDPAVLVERMRRVHAILGGEDVAARPAKKERKSRAAPFTQAQMRRVIQSAGGRRVTFNPDGSFTIDSGNNPKINVADEREIVF